jgi:sortase (surface protein transpeptidase)
VNLVLISLVIFNLKNLIFPQLKRKKEKKKHKHKHKHKHHREKKEKEKADKDRHKEDVTALSSESSGPPSPDMGLTF